MTNTENAVATLAYEIARKRGIQSKIAPRIEGTVEAVCNAKRLASLSVRELANAAIDRALMSVGRLDHGTGATNWL